MRRWLVSGLILLLLAAGSPDDWTNRLPYAGPAEKGVDKGAFLPGSEIQYLGKSGDRALVSIGGKETSKKIGDSLEWKEDVLKGVNVDQTYREGKLHGGVWVQLDLRTGLCDLDAEEVFQCKVEVRQIGFGNIKEGELRLIHRGHKNTSVQILVAPFTGRFRRKQAGMA